MYQWRKELGNYSSVSPETMIAFILWASVRHQDSGARDLLFGGDWGLTPARYIVEIVAGKPLCLVVSGKSNFI